MPFLKTRLELDVELIKDVGLDDACPDYDWRKRHEAQKRCHWRADILLCSYAVGL
jgi:hypothetical protein